MKFSQGELVAQSKTSYHLRDSDDIVVTTANKANQRFPRILSQDSDTGELWGLSLEIDVCL